MKKEVASIESITSISPMIADLIDVSGVSTDDGILLVDDTIRNISMDLDNVFIQQRTGIQMASDQKYNFRLYAKRLFDHYKLDFSEDNRANFLNKISPDLKVWIAAGVKTKATNPNDPNAEQQIALKSILTELLPKKGDARNLAVVCYQIENEHKAGFKSLNKVGIESGNLENMIRGYVRLNKETWSISAGAGAELARSPSKERKARSKSNPDTQVIKKFGQMARVLGITDAAQFAQVRQAYKTDTLTVEQVRDWVIKHATGEVS